MIIRGSSRKEVENLHKVDGSIPYDFNLYFRGGGGLKAATTVAHVQECKGGTMAIIDSNHVQI